MSLNSAFPIDKWKFKSEFLLKSLQTEELEMLLANRSEQVYSRGEVIFRENAIPSGIFYVSEGKVKKYKADKNGKEQIIYVATAGELIGYHAVLEEGRYPDSAAPLEKSKISFIPKEDFFAALQKSQVLNGLLLKMLSHEFAVLVNIISLLTQKSARERLAVQLIVLREKYKLDAHVGKIVDINITRSDLANLVGTARENVVRLLSEFKEEGIVTTTGRKIQVNGSDRLLRIANIS